MEKSMSDGMEIIERAPSALSTPTVPMQQLATTPMELLSMVTARGASIEEISKFMDLMERQQASEARQAFLMALANFKKESIVITKDKDNLQFKSRYTTIGNLVSTVTPFLSKHGLSADWDIDQSAGIKVTCILSHSLGGSKSVSFTVPPDTSGSKNVIQQIKSSITYAKAVTFESVCGLASTDANLDDDGNKFGTPDTALADNWIAKVKAAPTDADVVKVWEVGIEPIQKSGDKHAYTEFKNAVAERRADLGAKVAKK